MIKKKLSKTGLIKKKLNKLSIEILINKLETIKDLNIFINYLTKFLFKLSEKFIIIRN